jgi:hypothetical protein
MLPIWSSMPKTLAASIMIARIAASTLIRSSGQSTAPPSPIRFREDPVGTNHLDEPSSLERVEHLQVRPREANGDLGPRIARRHAPILHLGVSPALHRLHDLKSA